MGGWGFERWARSPIGAAVMLSRIMSSARALAIKVRAHMKINVEGLMRNCLCKDRKKC